MDKELFLQWLDEEISRYEELEDKYRRQHEYDTAVRHEARSSLLRYIALAVEDGQFDAENPPLSLGE